MTWLILSENEDKAEAFRNALAGSGTDFISVSTDGLAWVAEISIEETITYRVIPKKGVSSQTKLRSIQDAGADCDRVLLAFDPDTLGEACAWEYGKLLGMNRCARWPAPSLEGKAIRNEIDRLEAMDQVRMPKPDQGRVDCYWVQRVIDHVWADKTTEWLLRHNPNQPKVTRLMAALLRVVAELTHQRECLSSPQKFWELRCSLKAHTASGKKVSASVIVPPGGLLDDDASKTKRYWRTKTREANDRGLQQPKAGDPWRFNRADAVSHIGHLKKFPYFAIEKIDTEYHGTMRTGPLTYPEIHQMAAMTSKKSTPESIDRHLMELYHMGWITQPKSTNPNLKASTVAEIVDYAKRHNLVVDATPYRFGTPEDNRWDEAIRPTQWERRPEKVALLFKDVEGSSQKIWLYRMIYQFALNSQLAFTNEGKSRIYLFGPLTEPINGNRSGTFLVAKEQRFDFHMKVILGLDWVGEIPEKDTVFECITCEILEKTSGEVEPLTEENLIQTMVKNNLGKRKPLRDMISWLKKEDYLHENEEGVVYLSKKGHSMSERLNAHFGQCLAPGYHHSVTTALGEVEAGIYPPQEFLDEWWASLSPALA